MPTTRASSRTAFAALCLVLGLGMDARAQDAATCVRGSLDAVSKAFGAIESLYTKCPLKGLSRTETAACVSGVDVDKEAQVYAKLAESVTATCPQPTLGTGTCAAVAAGEGFDIISAAFAGSPSPESDGVRRACRKAIGTAGAKFGKAVLAALTKCNRKALDGVAGYGPAGPLCTDPLGTPQASISDAELKARDRITKKCAGPDKMLGTIDDLDPQDALGFPNDCNGLPWCSDPIPGVDELADCVVCAANAEVGQMLGGVLALPLPSVEECRMALGRAYTLLADNSFDDLSTCEERVIRGTIPGPCPDASTLTSIAANASAAAAIAGASCAGIDPQADLGFFPFCPSLGCIENDPTTLAGMFDCLACITNERTGVLVDAVYPVTAEETDPDREDCRLQIGREITANSTSFAPRKLARIRGCENTALCGQIPGPCPDSETADRIARVRDDIEPGIENDCTGIDPQDLGFPATCPAEYTCGGQETDTLGGLIACLTCLTDNLVDELDSLYYPGP